MTIVTIGGSGLGNVGRVGIPKGLAAVAMPAGTPLMIDANGNYAPNDGVNPPVFYSPAYTVVAGQRFTPQGNTSLVVADANYTVGAKYYRQADNTITTTANSNYVGTATSKTVLVSVPETAAMIAASATPPDIVNITDKSPASATNKLLSANSFLAPGNSTPGTVLAGTGTVSFTMKPQGVHVFVDFSARPAANAVFAKLPALPTGTSYESIIAPFNTDVGGGMGTISAIPTSAAGVSGGDLSYAVNGATAGNALVAAFFVPYA